MSVFVLKSNIVPWSPYLLAIVTEFLVPRALGVVSRLLYQNCACLLPSSLRFL